MQDISQKKFVTIMCSVIAFFVLSCLYLVYQTTEFKKACEARGGVAKIAPYSKLCLDPKALR